VPADDYSDQGITTNNTSSNILMQDVYVDGMAAAGLYGAVGGPITMTRVYVGFNGFAGWNFDDGTTEPSGSAITASYVTMTGNGCDQEYPLVHAFPAFACYDDSHSGFGDSWSGGNTPMTSFSCDHCSQFYNAKDGFIGPHTLIQNLSLTNSQWYANGGSQLKWGTQANGSTLFQNNFVDGNCNAMSVQIPGAVQNFNSSTGLPGSYLGDYCRAAGAPFAINSSANSTFLFAGNTIVAGMAPTTLQMSCVTAGTCSSTTWQFTDNIFLGYAVPANYGPFGGGYSPALYWTDDTPSTDLIVNSSHNLFFGNKSGSDDCTGGYGGVTLTSTSPICASPLLAGQPSTYSGESEFLPFIPSTTNLYPSIQSPAIGAGIAVPGITNDYYGVTRPNPPSIGAIEP
jgi:hypothetical protein